jgi:tetratricopeptide (TPR) repeat protein
VSDSTATNDAWDILRLGDAEAAIRTFQEHFARQVTGSSIMELGIAYLWIRDYRSAWEHFNRVNQARPLYGDGFYAMAGVAKWCLNERDIAIAQWRDAVRCEFSDPSSVGSSLLLFFASVMEPTLITRAEAEKVMAQRLTLPQASLWPGPLARYILGDIDTNQLEDAYASKHHDETWNRRWFADFYRGVLSYAAGNIQSYKEMMLRTADTSRPEWEDKRFFFSALWTEEFFLARHEST